MMFKPASEEQRLHTVHAMQSAGLDVQSAWIRYFSLSGNADEFDVDAYLNGLASLPPLDCDLLSHAVNELVSEAPPP